MRYQELIKTPKHYQKIKGFISFKTLKGYPCPFCRDRETKLEKVDEKGQGFGTDLWDTDIRVCCKTCRRVENYIRVTSNYKNNEITHISNYRSVLQISEEVYLDMEEDKFTLYDRYHRFKFEVPPFFINYLELDKIAEKIEIMATFS